MKGEGGNCRRWRWMTSQDRKERGGALQPVHMARSKMGRNHGCIRACKKGVGVREDARRAHMGLMPLACDRCIEVRAVWQRGRRGHLGWWATEMRSASSWLGDPLVIRAHNSGFVLGRHTQLALRREALLCVRSGHRHLSLLQVLELVIFIILVVLSALVAGIHYLGSVATVRLQMHQWHCRWRENRPEDSCEVNYISGLGNVTSGWEERRDLGSQNKRAGEGRVGTGRQKKELVG